MSKHRCFWALAVMSLVALISSAGGCAITASPEPSAPPATTTETGEADSMAASTGTDSVTIPTAAPADETLVDSDPVSGGSEEVDLSWEQLCLSSQYQVQIAKDPDFSIIVIDTGAFAPADSTSPATYYPAGARAASPSAIAGWGNLEAGHTYYWRARVLEAATGQWMRSPWSEVKSFTVKAGLPANSPSYGLQLLYPGNARTGCPVKSASFSWSPLNETTKYRFVLAEDAAMTQIVQETEVTGTAYEHDGTLDYDTNYFWRVECIEPACDPSATFTFRTESAPPPPAAEPATPPAPPWVWVVTAIGFVLIIVTIVLIFRARRR